MQFQVPQFIEVEDKIFGPLTFKQFVYIAGGLGIAYLLFRALPLSLAGIPMVLVVGLSLAFAFIEINRKPFISILESGFYFLMKSKLYLWKSDYQVSEREKAKQKSAGVAQSQLPALTENKLKNLSWSLDINERLHVDRAREEGGIRSLGDDIKYSE